MNRLACVAAVVLLQSACAASFPLTIRATRLPGNPMIREQMLPGEDGASINGPSLIRVPEWVVKPLGRYYLYFAHHAGKYIRLAYADRLEGPWTVYPGGVLRLDSQQGLAGHLASPEAVVDREGRRILLFVHGKPAGVTARKMPSGERDPEAGQRSIAAVSTDGLRFEAAKALVGPAYLRVFRRGDYWYALNQRTLMRTAKLGSPFTPVADIIGDDIAAQVDPLILKEPGAPQDRPKNGADRYSIRHVGVDLFGDWLLVYFTCVGHRPERILATAVDMRGAPEKWKAAGVVEILRPETDWEGANRPLEFSKGGVLRTPERQLRDPAVFAEEGKRWLAYSVAGEHGLGIAELTYTKPKPDFVLQDQLHRAEPFADSRLQINPPTFRWAAVAGARMYEVEIARSPSFEQPDRERVAELFFRPLVPFAAGTWYWRHRASATAAVNWSETESFTIDPALPRWTVPDWKQSMARIPVSHPRLFLTAAQVAGLRSTAARLDLRPWIKSARERGAKPYDPATYRAQLPSGSGHGFSDQQVKKKLIWTAKAAGVDAAEPISDLAWLALATGDESLLKAAKSRALMAAALDPHGFVSHANSDFGNGALVYHLGVAYDLMYDRLSPEERSAIRRCIVVRAAPIFESMRGASQRLMRAHNWQSLYLDGLTGALAIYGEEPAAKEWVELGLKSFVAFFPWYGGNDGGSAEGAKYFYGLEMIPSLLTRDLLFTSFGLDLAQGNPWFRNSVYYLMYSYPPASTKAKLGDSIPGPDEDEDEGTVAGGKGRSAASRLAALFDDGFAAAYAAALPEDRIGYSAGELIRWAGTPPPQPRPLATLPSARLFADIGAVFTHSAYDRPAENVRLVFHSSPYGGFGHGHADQNSFHVIAYDEDLLLDSGYYTPAGDPHREEWSLQTKAHNTILVDGQGQPYGDTSGYGRIRHFADNADWTYMVGSAETAYKSVDLGRFDRHMVWLKHAGVQTFVVIDDLRDAGQTSHRFDWLLHAVNRMEIDESRRSVLVRGARGEALVTFVEPARLQLRQDDKFDAPAIYWRKGKDYALPNQWHLKATPPPAARARFVTVIQVTRPGAVKPRVQPVEAGVLVDGWQVRLPEGASVLEIERRKRQ